ncbi:hypothetical protein OG530_19190 [Streptomyces decoyicus]|uniref:hypothetical protein n=1 Tax=Streptomyces decoyicus TaxID=249567 RepID=UPI002E172488
MAEPTAPSDEARALLAEAAEDYAANEGNRRRAEANAAADEQANARADAADNGGTW